MLRRHNEATLITTENSGCIMDFNMLTGPLTDSYVEMGDNACTCTWKTTLSMDLELLFTLKNIHF